MLRKAPFTESHLDQVQDFHCGDQPWDLEVSDWITATRGNDGALDELLRGKCDVWLYLNELEDVVGFASLGSTNWKYPTASDQRLQINIIPNVAIASTFQGQGFFKHLLAHLFYEAKLHTERLPLIGLFVDPRNDTAMNVYKRYGFQEFHYVHTDRLTNVSYRSMICKLPE